MIITRHNMVLIVPVNNMNLQEVTELLTKYKAHDISVLDVTQLTDIADHIIVCTGTSSTHIRGIGKKIVAAAKNPNMAPPNTEGEDEGEWLLIDLGDIIVNVMKQETREFYQLEQLWQQ